MGLFDKLFGGKKKDSGTEPPGNFDFTASDKLMDEDQFWKIIAATKDIAGDEYERQQEELAISLRKMAPDEIILFGNRFRYFRGLAYSWELWGAIYIIHGGCGDDGFNDFREWVIAQGRDFYYVTIKDPETLVALDRDKIEEVEWEGLGYVPSTVFEKLTGQKMPYLFRENTELTGHEWAEKGDDLRNRFPQLSAKYSENL